VIDKITNLVKQMSEDEKESLHSHIRRQYALEEKTGMLRDDIIDKVIELIQINFVWISSLEEKDNLEIQNLMVSDLIDFSTELEKEFEIENIALSETMQWITVADIVNYIEDNLECALHDKESQDG